MEGNEIDRKVFSEISHYKSIKRAGKDVTVDVPNYESPDIYRNFTGKLYKVYLDGPIAIGVWHNKCPIALVSFSLQDKNTIYIHQMQKVAAEYFDRYGRPVAHKSDPILEQTDRQQGLYEIIKDLSKKYGCTKIIIQGTDNNKRTEEMQKELSYSEEQGKAIRVFTSKPHMSKKISEKIYDLFAEKNGFEQDEKSKDWEKKI